MGKYRGQHFLIDKNIARKIANSADLNLQDYVLEIGPGKGILTEQIFPKVKKVIAIEIDKKLVQELKEKYSKEIQDDKLEIICADFLKFDLNSFRTKKIKFIKIVANIPYYITGAVLRKIFDFKFWELAVLLLQREVAERLKAKSGSKNYGLLSILSQVYTRVNVVSYVPRHVFRPIPKVDSAIVCLERLLVPLIDLGNEKNFFYILHAAFSQRRKILLNTLAHGLNCKKQVIKKVLEKLGFSPDVRAEQLSVVEFKRLALACRQAGMRFALQDERKRWS